MAAAAVQILTIPLAILCQFKAAYILTYVMGYCYGTRYATGRRMQEKNMVDTLFCFIAVIGLIIRILLDGMVLDGVMEQMADLLIQWIKLFQGSAIFIATINLIPENKWNCAKNGMARWTSMLAGCSFEIYIVHEFFTCNIFTHFISGGWIVKLCCVCIAIVLATALLIRLEKLTDFIVEKVKARRIIR